MKTYKEIETGVIEWRETVGESTTIGLIIEGQTRTRQVQTGETEPELDEDGNVTIEAQPIFEDEFYSPWDELLDSAATIEWISDEEKVAQAEQIARDARIAELTRLLTDSDFKVLPDYDKPIGDLKEHRQAWRDEIRDLTDGV